MERAPVRISPTVRRIARVLENPAPAAAIPPADTRPHPCGNDHLGAHTRALAIKLRRAVRLHPNACALVSGFGCLQLVPPCGDALRRAEADEPAPAKATDELRNRRADRGDRFEIQGLKRTTAVGPDASASGFRVVHVIFVGRVEYRVIDHSAFFGKPGHDF